MNLLPVLKLLFIKYRPKNELNINALNGFCIQGQGVVEVMKINKNKMRQLEKRGSYLKEHFIMTGMEQMLIQISMTTQNSVH